MFWKMERVCASNAVVNGETGKVVEDVAVFVVRVAGVWTMTGSMRPVCEQARG